MRPLMPVPFSVTPPKQASHSIHHSRVRNTGLAKLITNGKNDEFEFHLLDAENKYFFDENALEMFKNHEYYRIKEITMTINNTENWLKVRGAFQASYVHDPEGRADPLSVRFQDTQLVRIGKAVVWQIPVLKKWLYTTSGGSSGSKRLSAAGKVIIKIRSKQNNVKDAPPNGAESYKVAVTIDAIIEFCSKTRILRLGGIIYRIPFTGDAGGQVVNDYVRLFTKTDDRDYYLDIRIAELFPFKPAQGFFFLQSPVMVTFKFHSSEETNKIIIYDFMMTNGNFYMNEDSLSIWLRTKVDIGSAYSGTDFQPDELSIEFQYDSAYLEQGIIPNFITFMPDDFEKEKTFSYRDQRPRKFLQ